MSTLRRKEKRSNERERERERWVDQRLEIEAQRENVLGKSKEREIVLRSLSTCSSYCSCITNRMDNYFLEKTGAGFSGRANRIGDK